MSKIAHQLRHAISLIQASHSIVALTGAGISTASGIPDFRSPSTGLWEGVDPLEVASLAAFRQDARPFYQWLRPLAQQLRQAQPNPAHFALAQMEAAGLLTAVITQNIDLLHSKAGSQTVYEVHGHIRQATCLGCHHTVDGTQTITQFLETDQIPRCPRCGHVLKPDVILFGESLPSQLLYQAQLHAQACDLMIVAGSSLEVSPINELPWLAKQAGARVIFINFEETSLDPIADLLIRADVVEVLPQLATVLPNRQP